MGTDREPRTSDGRGPLLLVFLTTLVICSIGVSTPALWRDEAATVSATQRTVPELWRLLGHIDAVHGAYYLLVHPLVALFGSGETVLRLPSVLAAACTAAGVAWLGGRLDGWRTGMLAGLAYALSPMVSRYAQEARSYAIVSALAVLSTCLLVKTTEKASAQRFAAYGACLALLGTFNIFGLLIVPAHGLLVWGRHREAVRGWAVTVAAVAVVLSPLIWLTSRQRDQVSWLPKPSPGEIWVLLSGLTGSALLLGPVLLTAGYGLWRAGDLRTFVLAWALIPPVLLLTVSLVTPLYTFRYVLVCLPAVSLALGAGLARLSPRWRPVAGVISLVLAVPGHVQLRQQDSRIDDLRAMASVLRAHARPGDGLLFDCAADRRVLSPYRSVYRRLIDITLIKSAADAGNMEGTSAAGAEAATRLRQVDRIWVLSLSDGSACHSDRADLIQAAGGFSERGAGRWRFRGGALLLVSR
ncbi:glycosyltransferase family 39 protein [Actinomadura sp. 6N118]|uniref:glycosyltransferase family 39 protein n=1 Tax=Actinomadura sp. 6N118 TaxID=3375151 RepID=UPI0037A1AA6C